MDLSRKPTGLPILTHLMTCLASTVRPLAQCLMTLMFLPYEAFISLDAIVRTDHASSLDEVATAGMENIQRQRTSTHVRTCPGFYRAMLVAPCLATVVIGLAGIDEPPEPADRRTVSCWSGSFRRPLRGG
jgi:cyclic beta-1,2-glucan synthetase